MKNIIPQRRSIFPAQFSDRPIEKKDLEQLFEAAQWAPTHRKTEPWRFKVYQGNQKIALGLQMIRAYRDTTTKYSDTKAQKIATKVTQSPVVIAIGMQRDPGESIPEWEEIASTAMAVQNLWLKATELGLGGYWSSPHFASQLHSFLDMAPGERCLGFFYLGHYEGPIPQRMPSAWQNNVQWFEE